MKNTCLFTLLIFIYNISLKAATCTATNGAWNSATTWSCGHIPTAGDIAVIPTGVTVTVTNNLSTTATTLNISGTISFSNGAKLNLPTNGTVNILSGGQVTGGNGGSVLNIGATDIYTGGGVPLAGPTTCTSAGCGVLPVTLVSFNAIPLNNNSALLKWETINEKNSHYFVIKRGNHLNNLATIAQIEAVGSSNSRQSYAYTDNEIPVGISYYQLEQTDKDGSTQYFRPLSVIIEDTTLPFTVYPNPTNGQLFRVKVYDSENDSITLTTKDGKSISIKTTTEFGNTILVTPEQKLPGGVYFINVKNSVYDRTHKIVIQE